MGDHFRRRAEKDSGEVGRFHLATLQNRPNVMLSDFDHFLVGCVDAGTLGRYIRTGC